MNIFHFLFRKKIGITLRNSVFERIANQGDTAAKIITEALLEEPNLQLLVVVLEGKKETKQIYGSFFMFIL